MANLNDRDVYNRDNNPNNPNVAGNSDNRVPAGRAIDQTGDYHVVNPDPVDYRQGYVEGRTIEQQRYEADQQIRDNDNAGRGLLLGILLTGLVALTAGAFYFLNQRDRTPTPVNRTIIVPTTAPSTSPSPSPSPEVRERIIERDRVVPVPQESAPAPAPKINITVPKPAAPAPTQSAPTQSAPTESTTPKTTSPDSSAQPKSSDTSTSRTSDRTNSSSDSTGSSSPQNSGQ
jgi:hypothetical protein